MSDSSLIRTAVFIDACKQFWQFQKGTFDDHFALILVLKPFNAALTNGLSEGCKSERHHSEQVLPSPGMLSPVPRDLSPFGKKSHESLRLLKDGPVSHLS